MRPISRATQSIHPAYTDLLLYDMGEGVADNRPVFEAGTRDWCTAALGHWTGVEGRWPHIFPARWPRPKSRRSLWHNGEAEAARKKYRAMPKLDCDALDPFLEFL